MIKPVQFLLLLVICSVAWMACEQERDPCLQPRTVSMRMVFNKAVETDTGIAVSDSALPNAMIGVLDSPFALAYAAKNLKELSFTLSPLADSTSIFIRPDSARTTRFDLDTVTFFYQRRLAFISTACGYTYHYFLTGLRNTAYNIDSVAVLSNDVTNNVNVQHVKVYY